MFFLIYNKFMILVKSFPTKNLGYASQKLKTNRLDLSEYKKAYEKS